MLKGKLSLLAIFNLISFVSLSLSPADSAKTGNPKKNIYRGANKLVSDIIHTSLHVKFDWEKSQLIGEANIIAKPFFKPENKIVLDARGMDIQSVEVFEYATQKNAVKVPLDGMPASMKLNSSYKYFNDSLRIDLGRQFGSNERYLLKIKYVAKPNDLKKGGSSAITEDKGLYFINPTGKEKDKMPQIWTQGETQASSAWFPTVDSPNEKMTNEIFMTVDNKYTTLSNGMLTDSKKNADGTRTDHWVMDQPHSPYLVMMSVGEFKKVTDIPWNGKEISYYVEKEYEPYAKEIFGDTREMIEFFSKALGTPYPWQKYSQVVVRDYVSGAMENTSATLHGDFMVYQNSREMLDGKKGEDVISHELFHQWFGDLVTAESWSNLPLNESFATYGEYLWQEYKHGRDAADAHSYQSRMGYFNSSEKKEVDMIRFNYGDKEEMFDAFSYNKGGQILHMLRKYVGDEAFFTSLKLYLEKNKFKSAEIHDLRLAFEEVSGEDLNWFFNQWFLSKGYPVLDITKEYDASAGRLKLKVKQLQDLKEMPLYNLPVDVDIYVNGKAERHRITINKQEQEFIFKANAAPQLVNFDAERQLLCKRKYSKTDEEYIFQYIHAPLYGDRFEALTALGEKVKSKDVFDLVLGAAANDKWYELRSEAISVLKTVAKEKEDEVKPVLINVAKEDKNNLVRSAAVRMLGQAYKDPQLSDLLKGFLNDRSYSVLSSALRALSAIDGSAAVSGAGKFNAEKNVEVLNAVASVYAMNGSQNNIEFFHDNIENMKGFSFMEFLYYYTAFISKCVKPSAYETFYNDLTQLTQNEDKYISGYVKNVLRDEFLPLVNKKVSESGADQQFIILKQKLDAAVK